MSGWLAPEDLVAVPRERPVLPTFAEYVSAVSAAVTVGTRRAYGSCWNRVIEQWSDLRSGGRRRWLIGHGKRHAAVNDSVRRW